MKDFELPIGRLVYSVPAEWADEQRNAICHYVEGVCGTFDLTADQCTTYSKLAKFESPDQRDYKFLVFEFSHPAPNYGHRKLLEGVASYLLALGGAAWVSFEKYPYKSRFS